MGNHEGCTEDLADRILYVEPSYDSVSSFFQVLTQLNPTSSSGSPAAHLHGKSNTSLSCWSKSVTVLHCMLWLCWCCFDSTYMTLVSHWSFINPQRMREGYSSQSCLSVYLLHRPWSQQRLECFDFSLNNV